MTGASSPRRDAALPSWSPARVGRVAVRALFEEAVLERKPGLVSARDSGAHADMSLATFYRSIASLRPYFPAITALGAAGAPWRSLQAHGQAAEAVMLRATGGVNTHRGAIFHLGLLCAATGALAATGRAFSSRTTCGFIRRNFGRVIVASRTPASHGGIVERRYGAGGARAEAASGYPSVRRWALPAYRAAYAHTGDRDRAALQALFALIANVEDTNLLWRGGCEGLAFAQGQARRFLDRGGVLAPDWLDAAMAVHRAFVARHLSPGGCADLLAVTLMLHELDREACRH